MHYHYKSGNFLHKSSNRHPISRPWGQDMGCVCCEFNPWFMFCLNHCTTAWNIICFNSLAPEKFEWNFRYLLIFQIISVIDGWVISCELVLRWMSLDLTDDKSTLVQVMAWCRLATNHYLSQCWPRSLSSYGVIRPKWVKPCYSSTWLYIMIKYDT